MITVSKLNPSCIDLELVLGFNNTSITDDLFLSAVVFLIVSFLRKIIGRIMETKYPNSCRVSPSEASPSIMLRSQYHGPRFLIVFYQPKNQSNK